MILKMYTKEDNKEDGKVKISEFNLIFKLFIKRRKQVM